MKATSPALNKPKRSEEEARWDYEHRMNTNRLAVLRAWLFQRGHENTQIREWGDTLGYALERLHKEQAEIYKERARNQ